MKNLNLFLALFATGAIFGCKKSSLNAVKPSTSTSSLTNSLIADSVRIYAGKVAENPVELDGPLSKATFWGPGGMTLDASGNLYVGDYYGDDIRKITPDGMVSTISTGIDMPEYLAFDASGKLYMTYNKIVQVLPTGSLSLIDSANYDGLAADNSGNVYAATLQRIMKLDPSTGKMNVYAGTGKVGSTDGDLSTATFTYIEGITFDKKGNIFVLDSNSIRIVDVANSQVKTLTLKGSQSPFNNPQGLAVDQWDNVYVANYGDSNSGNGYILKITPDGTASNFAGNRQKSGNPGGLQGAAQSVSFDGATGIILLPSGNFLVGCMSGNVIQEIITHKQQ